MKKVFMTAVVMASMFVSSCSLEEVEPEKLDEVNVPAPSGGGNGEDPDHKSGD